MPQCAGTAVVTLVIVSGVPSIAVRVAGRDDPGMQGNLLLAAAAGDYGARPEVWVAGAAGTGRSGQGGDAGPAVGLSLEPAGTAAGGAAPGGTVLTQPGYGTAAGRLDVDAASGVSQVTIAAR